MLYIRKANIEKKPYQKKVGQEMVAINDQKIPISVHFLVEI